jgi:hypothetical protein
MFNLEQSIAEWRRKMVAAGIKSSEVLDELESHLREEVERQMRLGLAAEQAFNESVEKIGSGEKLEQEFTKMQALDRLGRREILRRWSAIAGAGFVYSVLASVWFMGARQGMMEITLMEIALAGGAMAPMIGLGWAGNRLAKRLPAAKQEVIVIAAIGVIFVIAAALRLAWGAITPDNLVHTQIILLWTLSPLPGTGICLSAWVDNSKRRELEISH